MAHISLRKITKDNYISILRLKVKPSQQKYVATNGNSLAQAQFHEEAWHRAIYADEQPVGFVMLSIIPEKPEYFVWRFMIDAEYQGRGYGRSAMRKVVDYVRTLNGAKHVRLSYIKGDEDPADFYVKCGFAPTGEMEDGEHIMQMDLEHAGDDDRLVNPSFPRCAKYNADWILEGSFGGNALWLTEWLTDVLELKPGMRILDIGCGRAKSSIFLANEFDVQVWATDLWIHATENRQRIEAAEMSQQVFPIHADARALPFASDFFDAIICVDAFPYFGTDDLYLNYLAQFVKPGGPIAVAGAALMKDFDGPVPQHLEKFWGPDCCCLHTLDWWRNHWLKTKIVDIQQGDTMPDGIAVWQQWTNAMSDPPEWFVETLSRDAGEYLGYFRLVGNRNAETKLLDVIWPNQLQSWPVEYKHWPFLRGQD